MFLCPLDQCEFWSHHLKRFLTDLYGLELDYEQMGRGLTFLEVEVWWDGCNVEWGLKNKVLSGLMTKNPPIRRYPAPHDKDAATHVPGLAMAVGMKACKIATSPQRVHSNFAHAIWEFRHLQYPRRWWDPHLHAWYKKSTARMPWSDLQQSLQWLVPVPAKMCILDPTVQQPVCGLVGENTVHILQSAWADMPLLTLKSAVQLPVTYIPEGMHKPRAQRKKPATATRTPPPQRRRPTATQPIAHRTRSRAPSRKTTTHTKTPQDTRDHHRTEQKRRRPDRTPQNDTEIRQRTQTRVSNQTRKTVHVTAAGTEIQMQGVQLIQFYDMWDQYGGTISAPDDLEPGLIEKQ